MGDILHQVNNINAYRRMLRRERIFRDRNNPFDIYNDEEFHAWFRFTKENILFISDLVREELTHLTNRSCALSLELQLCTAWRYFVCGSFQIVVGDTFNISQPTVSKCVSNVCIALASLKPQFIKFPKRKCCSACEGRLCFNVAGFPNVIGVIDCTHIPIFSIGKDYAEKFRNRKGFYSINTQVICDAHGYITNIVSRCPGSTHDSRTFHESNIKRQFENRHFGVFYLGIKDIQNYLICVRHYTGSKIMLNVDTM